MKMNIPYIEKYRPKTFDEIVGVSELDKIKNLISDVNNMPNLMFVGPAGVGKTSAVKVILKELSPINYLRINGSDTTGVDTIRDKVYNFVTSKSTEPNKPRIVWIEEFDYMSGNAFAALRSMIEQFISNARFIVTLNYINKIPEPIQSRFTVIHFEKPKEADVFDRIKQISELEKIKCTDEVLSQIIKTSNGDMRTIVNNLQRLSANDGKEITTLSLVKLDSLANHVYKLILEKKWSTIRYDIPDEHPDYEDLLVKLEDLFFDSEIETSKKAAITEIISNSLYEMSFSFNKDICFAACCSKIIKAI